MTITYYRDLVQGTDEWHAVRCGLITASEMKLLVTPTLKVASNDKERAHLFELLAQRITNYVEPLYVSDDMLRGQQDEIDARDLYEKHHARVEQVGFVVNDQWGFKIGYSPDGLVGDDGLIECKSRMHKHQVKTILSGNCPDEHLMQVQTGLLVTGRKWCDYISYSAGLPMMVVRVFADDGIQAAIVEAATAAEANLAQAHADYEKLVKALSLIPTERKIQQEIF